MTSISHALIEEVVYMTCCVVTLGVDISAK